ncbi:MAG: hypothetical protein II719_04915, partial [Clostridia bacterium]|nr:hypothetical protein [Clostridia bacterium]
SGHPFVDIFLPDDGENLCRINDPYDRSSPSCYPESVLYEVGSETEYVTGSHVDGGDGFNFNLLHGRFRV